MARRKRNESPERQALSEMMSVILEGALDGELDDELGYSKYDYKNKDTGNSRNGYSKKTMHTSYGDMDLEIPRDRNGEYEPQVIKKYQNTITQDMEEKIISMYAKLVSTFAFGESQPSVAGLIFPCINDNKRYREPFSGIIWH
jgi:transposase-like protein